MNTAIPTITNQPTKENAIITTTTSKTYSVVAESNTNNRTKRARWAKNLATNPGVFSVTLGDIRINEGGDSGYATFNGAEVQFNFTIPTSAENAGAPWYIKAAWLNGDLELIAALVIQTSDGEGHLWEHHQKTDDMPAWLITKDGYPQRAYEVQSNLGYGFNDGDQHGYFQYQAAKRAKADADRVEHERRIAAAHEAAASDNTRWRSRHVAEKAQSMTRDESITNQAEVKAAIGEVIRLMERQLWDICAKSVGKLRTEVEVSGLCDDEADRYGFVTLAEVERYILRRWATDGWSDQAGMRQFVASEFVRRNF